MKGFRKLCGLAFALAFMLSAGVSGYAKGADWHYNGGSYIKGRCDNTYRQYDCGDIADVVTAYTHETVDGRICYVYAEVHYHTLTCSSCGNAFMENEKSCCTTWHSVCGIYNPDTLALEE